MPMAWCLPRNEKPPDGGLSTCVRERGRSAFRELLAPPRLVQAHFLALDFARVARDEPGLRQRRLQLRVVLDQRPRDAVANRAGLTRLPAADDIDHDVERLLVVGQHEGLPYDHAAGL